MPHTKEYFTINSSADFGVDELLSCIVVTNKFFSFLNPCTQYVEQSHSDLTHKMYSIYCQDVVSKYLLNTLQYPC